MKYALVGRQRMEASTGGRGRCPACNSEVIAKCGDYRIPHWAHRGVRDCDSWAEKETEWHRAWKAKFSPDCQEVVLYDEISAEKHIADVKTSHGLVIEFQHSHLDPKERIVREQFYKNMVWVVDGARLQRDFPRFAKGKEGLRATDKPGYFWLSFPEECFPAMWVNSSVPVIFDFRGVNQLATDVFKDTLWCLLPGRAEGHAVVVGMSADQFVEVAPTRPHLLLVRETMEVFTQFFREARAQESAITMSRLAGSQRAWSQPRRFRRF